jgi:hypothetical protein
MSNEMGHGEGAYRDANEATWSNLTLVRKGFVVWPEHDAWVEGVRGDVLDLSACCKGATRGGEEGVVGSGFLEDVLGGRGGGIEPGGGYGGTGGGRGGAL